MDSKNHQVNLPAINMELVRIRAALPIELAAVSRYSKDKAVSLLRDWGQGLKPVQEIYKESQDYLESVRKNLKPFS